MKAKDKQPQEQTQIPFGNDKKKGEGDDATKLHAGN
jgi:hypothetical protein